MTARNNLNPGDLVRSRRGKDEDQLYVVLAALDERSALVADGDKRRFDRPKRKNVLHLEPLGIHSEEVAGSLRETGRVTNAKLRFAIAKAEATVKAGTRPPDDAISTANAATETRQQSDAFSVARGAEEKGE
ncbi:hypothetical protein [Cohnella sp. CFH 77786]|uniref:hypothetical protein n=1 Tax=Cohnella sp. CFH 77786 TaxID=2662265 RepID=UPI00351DA4CE